MYSFIKKMFKNDNIDIDTYDWRSHVDSTLSPTENYNIIKEDIKFLQPRSINPFKYTQSNSLNKARRYSEAQQIHENRKKASFFMDNRIQAKKVFDTSDLTAKNFKKWKKNPNKYDILGVDTKF